MQKPFYSADETMGESYITPKHHVDYFCREEQAKAWAAVHGGVVSTVHPISAYGVTFWKVRRESPGHDKRLRVSIAVGDPAKEAALVEETAIAEFGDLFGRK